MGLARPLAGPEIRAQESALGIPTLHSPPHSPGNSKPRWVQLNKRVNNSKSITVVVDDEDMRNILRIALENAGLNVLIAHSVDQAFETYPQSPPPAVKAGMRWGIADGHALIKTIRETDAEYRGQTPVTAIMGFVSPKDERRAMSAGFSYLHHEAI